MVDPITAAINRLPGVIQEDVHRLLALHAEAVAKAHTPEIFHDDEAVCAAIAVVDAYNAALRSISIEFKEPDLALNSNQDEDDPESFEGTLNIDAGSPAPAFPPFLQSQLDRRADAMRDKYAR
jgi:hypothetical protein